MAVLGSDVGGGDGGGDARGIGSVGSGRGCSLERHGGGAGGGGVHGVERVQASSVGLEAMGAAFVGAMFGEDGGVQELAANAAGLTEGETGEGRLDWQSRCTFMTTQSMDAYAAHTRSCVPRLQRTHRPLRSQPTAWASMPWDLTLLGIHRVRLMTGSGAIEA